MPLLIALGLFLFLLVVISAYGYRQYVRPARLLDQIGMAAEIPLVPGLDGLQNGQTFKLQTVLQWVGEKLPQSPREASLTRRLLVAAGYRSDAALPIYVGIRLAAVAGIVLAALAILSRVSIAVPMMLIGAGVAGMVGMMAPGIVLDELVKARRERLRYALPDALDLLVVCVESGLGLDQAIRMVSDELAITHPEISKELSLVSLEMRTGVNRATALRNLAERTGEAELRKLTAVLIQTDRFGTSLAESLRTHADFLRVRRKHEAEERAGKIGVKLTFAIFLFILPSILVVAGGPAVLKIAKELMPAIRNSGIGQ